MTYSHFSAPNTFPIQKLECSVKYISHSWNVPVTGTSLFQPGLAADQHPTEKEIVSPFLLFFTSFDSSVPPMDRWIFQTTRLEWWGKWEQENSQWVQLIADHMSSRSGYCLQTTCSLSPHPPLSLSPAVLHRVVIIYPIHHLLLPQPLRIQGNFWWGFFLSPGSKLNRAQEGLSSLL